MFKAIKGVGKWLLKWGAISTGGAYVADRSINGMPEIKDESWIDTGVRKIREVAGVLTGSNHATDQQQQEQKKEPEMELSPEGALIFGGIAGALGLAGGLISGAAPATTMLLAGGLAAAGALGGALLGKPKEEVPPTSPAVATTPAAAAAQPSASPAQQQAVTNATPSQPVVVTPPPATPAPPAKPAGISFN